jgi:hypothetical protein
MANAMYRRASHAYSVTLRVAKFESPAMAERLFYVYPKHRD